MGYFDVAAICLNGHTINSTIQKSPEFNSKYCKKCGQPSVTKCANCDKEIRGKYLSNGKINQYPYIIPNFCSFCGAPYPWTNKKINSIIEMVRQNLQLELQDVENFHEWLTDIISDNSNAHSSVQRINELLKKVNQKIIPILEKLIVDVAAESVKKLITLN